MTQEKISNFLLSKIGEGFITGFIAGSMAIFIGFFIYRHMYFRKKPLMNL
jgi:hypothetical protein